MSKSICAIQQLWVVLLVVCMFGTVITLNCTPVFNNGKYEGGYDYATGPAGDSACACKTNLRWNNDTLKCVVDCANIPYATGKILGDYECECIDGTIWSLFHFKCYVDCRSIPNAVYSQRYRICVPNCNVIEYAYGPAYITSTGVRCHCQTGFKWDWSNSMCVDTSTQTL